MRKLLSIITAVCVVSTSATTLTSCATKLLTNTYTIDLANYDELAKEIKHKWDGKDQYVPVRWESSGNDESAKIKQEHKEVKSSVNGVLNQGNAVVQDLMNVIFFNASTSITNPNRSLQSHQYIFKTDVNNVFVDGQSITAGINSNKKEDITNYYLEYEKSNKGIASILGLYEYSKYKEEQPTTKATPTNLINKEQRIFVNKMFNSSNNQGIKSIKFEQNSQFVDGKISLFNSNAEIGSQQKVDEYKTPWISKTKSNYSSKAKYGDGDLEKYIAGASSNLDPFSQTLLSNSSVDLKNSNIELKRVAEDADFSEVKKGAILNPSTTPNQPVTFEYKWNITKDKDGKETNRTLATNTYGYQLVKLEPVKMKIVYNDNIKLTKNENGEDDYVGNNYEIDITVDGLYAYFAPILGYIQNDFTEDLKNKEKLYLGWRLAGYQFNSTNILGYDEKGDALTNSIKPFQDKSLPLWKNKYNEMSITNFSIKEKESVR